MHLFSFPIKTIFLIKPNKSIAINVLHFPGPTTIYCKKIVYLILLAKEFCFKKDKITGINVNCSPTWSNDKNVSF